MKKEFINVTLRRKDVKDLNDYKVHTKQPYWEIIKLILEGKLEIRIK